MLSFSTFDVTPWHPDMLTNLCGPAVLSDMSEEILHCHITNSCVLQLMDNFIKSDVCAH